MATLRQTMIQARVADVINGKFVRKEGLEPSYVLTDLGQRISRVKLVGSVIDKFMSEDGNYSSITVDDDSDSIRVKAFKEDATMFDNLEIGDLALIIGKVREYAEENYVIPEVVKKIVNPDYESLHRLEVLKQLMRQKKAIKSIRREKENFLDFEELKSFVIKKYGIDEQTVEGILETLAEEEETKEKDYKPLLLETIDKLDKGKGVEMRKLLEESKLPEGMFEQVMNELLSEGLCYEPVPGVVKKV